MKVKEFNELLQSNLNYKGDIWVKIRGKYKHLFTGEEADSIKEAKQKSVNNTPVFYTAKESGGARARVTYKKFLHIQRIENLGYLLGVVEAPAVIGYIRKQKDGLRLKDAIFISDKSSLVIGVDNLEFIRGLSDGKKYYPYSYTSTHQKERMAEAKDIMVMELDDLYKNAGKLEKCKDIFYYAKKVLPANKTMKTTNNEPVMEELSKLIDKNPYMIHIDDYKKLRGDDHPCKTCKDYFDVIEQRSDINTTANFSDEYIKDIDADDGWYLDFLKDGTPTLKLVINHRVLLFTKERVFYTQVQDGLFSTNRTIFYNISNQNIKNVKILSQDKKDNSALKYIENSRLEDSVGEVVDRIEDYMHTPLEQFEKTEFKDIIQGWSKPILKLKRVFAIDYFKEGKKLHQVLGVNKYQMEAVIKENAQPGDTWGVNIEHIRTICDKKGIAIDSIQNDDFDTMYRFFKTIERISSRYAYRVEDEWAETYNYVHLVRMFRFINDTEDLVYKRYGKSKYKPDILHTFVESVFHTILENYMDYINMRCQLLEGGYVTPSHVPSTFRLDEEYPENEFIERHDQVTKWLRVMKKTIDKDKWDAQYEQWEKYEYKSTKLKLKVIAPKTSDELIKEGRELDHCVASYIDRIVKGDTSVMFIRKMEEPDKPYYTVEVQNGRIEQVHGLRNVNATKTVEAFVEAWAEARGLEITNYKKVRA